MLSLMLCASVSLACAGDAEPPDQRRSSDAGLRTVLIARTVMENHRGEEMPVALLLRCTPGNSPEVAARLGVGFPGDPVAFFHGTRPPFRVLIRVDGTRAGKVTPWNLEAGGLPSKGLPHAMFPDRGESQSLAVLRAMRHGRDMELHVKDSGDSVGRLKVSLAGVSGAMEECAPPSAGPAR